MPFTVYTKTRSETYNFDITYNRVASLAGCLSVSGEYIVHNDGLTIYVGEIMRHRIVGLNFGYYSGLLFYSDSLSFIVSPISDNEKNKYLVEINELANDYSPERATELINKLEARFIQLRDYVREAGINTEPISNIKRSFNH